MTRADLLLVNDIRNILTNGTQDENPRPKYEDGTPAYTYFVNHVVRTYNLQTEFPICTLRPIAWKSAIREIFTIYQKPTNVISEMEDMGVRWWNDWNIGDGTIGHRYGYTVKKYDLINNLINDIKTNPYGRRKIVSLWQENDLRETDGLAPCAFLTIWNVRGEYLDMCLIQRSGDMITATRKTESLKGHDEYYKVYTPIVKKYIDEHNLKDDSELPDYFVTAQTLDYKNRIYMQSIWQSHIDASISSTVNVPNDFTIEQVESLYMSAWESGLKGVTIFRDGCKRSGILTTTSSVSDINDDKEKKTLPRGYIVVADDNVIGLKRKVMSGCGSLHIVAMFDPITGELLETYISKGSTGGCQSNLAAVSRLISLSARAGVDVYTIADQLKSCPACPSYVGRTMTKHDTSKGKCCPDAIANALIDMYKEMKNSIFSDDIEMSNVKSKVIKKNTEDKEQSVNVKNPCPVCGEELTFEGGCNVCKACGWSKCD